jgi:outer membrane protein TolC
MNYGETSMASLLIFIQKKKQLKKRNSMKRILLFLLFNTTLIQIYSQKTSDSSIIVSFEQYLQTVKQNHPYLNATNLITQKADAERLTTKSFFDPYLSFEAGDKRFIENYYQYSQTELRLPLWWGMDLKTGVSYNNGPRLDNSETVGQNAYLGIQLPVLKNLLFDKRRAAVQQARIAQKQSRAEQVIERNNFLYDATLAYWRWSLSLELYTIAEQTFENNKSRLQFIKNSIVFGDRAAIDSVEQLTQFQMINLQRLNFLMDYKSAHYLMGAYLLDSAFKNKPIVYEKNILPVLVEDSLMAKVDAIVMNHPLIQQNQYKVAALKIEKKLKFQSLLPTLDLNLNLLSKNTPANVEFQNSYIQNNYQYGIKAGIPLRLSEGRGSYKLAQIKVNEQNYLLNFKTMELRSKLNMSINELGNYRNQLNLLEAAIVNYKKLLSAEEQKFKIGESSVFLINSREIKLFETQQKYIETKFKAIKAYYAYLKTAARME